MFGADRLDVVLMPVDDACMERSIVADSELVPEEPSVLGGGTRLKRSGGLWKRR